MIDASLSFGLVSRFVELGDSVQSSSRLEMEPLDFLIGLVEILMGWL